MTGIRRLSKSIQKLDVRKEDQITEFSGVLGADVKGMRLVEVPNRDGYVYVRLRSNLNEIIQAYNGAVSPVYDLPVTVTRDETFNRYTIKGRDLGRYGDWGTSPYLPRHGAQHSFSDFHYGGDIVWVHDRQFVPLSISPSGTSGSGNVFVSGDVYYYNSEWRYAGNTGTASLLPYKPTGSNARVVLVYLDTDGNPALEPGEYFDFTLTGINQIIPYLPTIPGSNGTPLGAVRLLSGTTRITWSNIYDLRPLVVSQGDFTAPYIVQDEGVTRTRRSFLNFKGQLVWAVDNPGDDATDIIVSGSSGAGHDAVTLDADAEVLLGLNNQEIGLDDQAVNQVFAGSPTGSSASAPTFRSLVAADLGSGTPDGARFLRDDLTWQVPSVTGSSGVVATDSIWDAKGDLAVGTGANTAAKFVVGGDSSLLMAASGEASGLKWLTTQFAVANVSGSTSANNATWTTVALDTETYDTDTMHSLVTNNSRLTCKTAGTYLIFGLVAFEANATGGRFACIRLNDTTDVSKTGPYPGDGAIITRVLCMRIITLAVNEFVELRAYQSSGGNLNIVNETWFAAIRIPGT